MIELANKKFVLVSESNVKDIGSKTLLSVNQDGDLFYGEYSGGKVVKGSFIARLSSSNTFERHFHHFNDRGKLVSGKGCGTIEIMQHGKIRLRASWDLNSQFHGDAIYDEIEIKKEKDMEDYYYNLVINK